MRVSVRVHVSEFFDHEKEKEICTYISVPVLTGLNAETPDSGGGRGAPEPLDEADGPAHKYQHTTKLYVILILYINAYQRKGRQETTTECSC